MTTPAVGATGADGRTGENKPRQYTDAAPAYQPSRDDLLCIIGITANLAAIRDMLKSSLGGSR